MRAVIRHLHRVALLDKGGGPTDGQLLESFLARREEMAFAALVRRHGPMVLGVCRRVLRNIHDAEDAFQATFLVLTRKAASIRPRDMVGNWLYGVAYRTALKARTMNAKHRAKEQQASEMPRSEASVDGAHEDLLARLDRELSRLPEKYRVPVVLCELEGKNRREVARLIGVPEGTLSWRLAYAKKLLAKRLSRHRSALSVSTLTAVLSRDAVSAPLLTSTAKALTAGVVPARVLALTEGVMKTMLLTKLKITVCVAALALLAGVGATGLTYRATAQETRPNADTPPQTRRAEGRPAADDLESLRLEIAALRRELRATRDQLKALEAEVHGPKGRGENRRSNTEPELRKSDARRAPAPATEQPRDRAIEKRATQPGTTEGPIAEAEAALKKLRERPDDQQAIEEAERALNQLKERAKPRVPGEVAPKRPR